MIPHNTLPVALLVLRLGLGLFLLLFGIDKLVAPEVSVEVYAAYYGLAVSHGVVYLAGLLESLLAVAFLAGLWKTLTDGLATALHAVSVLATAGELLWPFGAGHLFNAGIPVLAGFITLFLLRREDVLWAVSVRSGAQAVHT